MNSKRRVALVAIVAVVLGASYWLLWQSPYLTVRRVTFSIAGSTAKGWHDSTLRTRVVRIFPRLEGQHLVDINGARLAQQLNGIRGVLAADVRRGWPHDVAVFITPRVPIAVFEKRTATGSRWQLVDADAQVVAEVVKRPANWVVLDVSPATAGGRAAIDVWNSLPATIKSGVATMSSSRSETSATVQLNLKQGATVLWGAAEESTRKAQVLQALFRYKAKVYDVSVPDMPTTRQ